MPATSSSQLLRIFHDVFGEIDAACQRVAVAEISRTNAVFYAPDGVHRGRAETDRIAGVIKATHPGSRYQPGSPPEEMGHGGR